MNTVSGGINFLCFVEELDFPIKSRFTMDKKIFQNFDLLMNLIWNLVGILWIIQNYKIYFDRFYIYVPLTVHLFKQGIQCVGTIQCDRIRKCKFEFERELKKVPPSFLKNILQTVSQ